MKKGYIQKNLSNKINIFFLSVFRRIYLNLIDAHVNYVEDAYDILGSYGVAKKKNFHNI